MFRGKVNVEMIQNYTSKPADVRYCIVFTKKKLQSMHLSSLLFLKKIKFFFFGKKERNLPLVIDIQCKIII